MKLFLLVQDDNRGYDTYDSVVVAAESEALAREITPSSDYCKWGSTWADAPDNVSVQYLGEAYERTTPGIILASFNAG